MTGNANAGRVRRRGPVLIAGGVFAAVLIMWSVFAAVLAPDRDSPPQAAAPGWGQEAVESLGAQVAALSPIAAANACGMGASSCFKCHNGQRAAAPKSDRQSAPWHVDHRTVNNSCAGCHKGNPRLIKKELAHAGLIVDSRQKPAETCDNCHKTGNTAELLKQYQK
jgi:hypothetical protein